MRNSRLGIAIPSSHRLFSANLSGDKTTLCLCHSLSGVAKTRVRVTPRVRVRVRVEGEDRVKAYGNDCIDDHAAIIHPLLLLVLFSTKKKFS